MVITFITGNLNDCLMKELIPLKHLIMELLHTSVIMILIRVKFDGGCLKQDSGSFLTGGIVNVYIVYEISKNINISNYLTLENCLF